MATKVFVILGSGDREVALEVGLIYPLNAAKNVWMDEVKVILFGPSEKVAAYDAEVQGKIGELLENEVEVLACKWCSDRMGVTGGSYGGFMTNWNIGHTDRFKAAVTQRSVSNLISMYGSSDFNWTFQAEFGDVPIWENVENFWRQSPMKTIGNAKTPTLVIHSEQDLRCAIEQDEQVFVALKKLGVDTEMVRFPDEPHGLSRGGRTDRRIERLEHILRWFDRYLGV